VTTLALGLAARWPRPDAVLVEADAAGGDLAARFGLHHEPGFAAMALAARHADSQRRPQTWLQRLPCGVDAVLTSPGEAASASLAALDRQGPATLRLLAAEHPAVVLDAGRWRPGSAADPLLGAADVVLLVARPELDEIRQCDVRLPALRRVGGDVRLVLVGERCDWPSNEVGAALRVPVAEVLPVDRHGAGVLAGRMVPRKGWDSIGWTRLPLLRACHGLARRLEPQAARVPAAPPPHDSERVASPAVVRESVRTSVQS
jgi:MinD-like ATPase involved in chromosome partitioning or flagellar assembly